MKIWCPIQIRFRDLDPLSHVNNAVYFTYFEEARSNYFERLPHSQNQWQGEDMSDEVDENIAPTMRIQLQGTSRRYGILIKEVTCTYNLPIIHTDTIEIGTEIVSIGRTSIIMEHQIRAVDDHSRIFATGRSVTVWCNYRTGRPSPVPPSLRAAFAEIEGRTF